MFCTDRLEQSACTPSLRGHQPPAIHQWTEDDIVWSCLLAKGAFENICLEGAIQINIYYYYYYINVFSSLVAFLILIRLDYGNAVISGISACLKDRLQSVSMQPPE